MNKSMNRIIIVGGGGHAKVIISILKKLDCFNIFGYTDKIDNGRILGIKYLGNDDNLKFLFQEENVKNAVIGLGQIKNSSKRKYIYKRLSIIGFNFPSIISPNCIVNEEIRIGKGTVVMDGVIINPGTIIGDFCIVNTNVSVDHDCIVSDFVHIATGGVLSGGVTVGDNVLIGAGATIIQSKNICSNSIIGAGSVVLNDCMKPGTYCGIPAKLKKE